MNTWDEMRARLNEHRDLQSAIDNNINTMAGMIKGRLQSAGVRHDHLCALKRELARYNMHTDAWTSHE